MTANASCRLHPLTSVFIVVCFATLAGCPGKKETPPPAPPAPPAAKEIDADAIAANNRGVGLMGMFKYDEACAVFEKLVDDHPDWADARVNLALATLNRQSEGDEARAMALFEEVVDAAPENLRARYGAALLLLRDADGAQRSLALFEELAREDPDDPHVAYYLGSALERAGRPEDALAQYERAIELDPYLRSAYWRAYQLTLRARRPDDAQPYKDAFDRLDDNPRSRMVDYIYTKMGTKGECLAMGLEAAAPTPRPDGPVFADAAPLLDGAAAAAFVGPRAERVSMTAADVDGDGRVDLFAPGAIDGGAIANALLMATADGGFRLDTEHVLANVTDVFAALWGDYDNDGLIDVYLCRRGPNHLWRQAEPGRWEDVTAATGTAGGDLDTVDGAIFDADHDGDLDIFCVNADGPVELFNNDMDGAFRTLAAERGLADGAASGRQVVVDDLDADGDADILVVNQTPPHAAWENERLWSYRPMPGFDILRQTPVRAAVTADLDADGRVEIVTRDDTRLAVWLRGDDGAWRPGAAVTCAVGDGAGSLAALDVDGDGAVEIVADGPDGFVQWNGRAHGVTALAAADAPIGAWTWLVTNVAEGPSLVGVRAEGAPWAWAPGPGRHAFLAIDLAGRHDVGKSLRTNASGIGARLAVRADSEWAVTSTHRRTSGPGQGRQPVPIGLGGRPKLDFVQIDWTDGVLQSEVHGVVPMQGEAPRDFTAGRMVDIAEEQRLTSSCPVLFAWDGARFAFVSDLLGVGGLGYLVAPGVYAPPRPWENFMLPEGLAVPRDGQYVLKLGEPMQETCYVDLAHLVAYDLPPGWSMVLDERMSIAGPEPTGNPVFYRRAAAPRRAVNDRGEDVTARVAHVDHDAAPVGAIDHRFIGRLEHSHVLTLEFDAPIDGEGGGPVLVIDGWVEYPYSQTSFAAWQADAVYEAPTVEARGSDGAWRPVLEQFGYPAGMPRQMSVPLEGLPPGTTALRLSTNQEIYWDRLLVAWAEPCPDVQRVDLRLEEARLERPGFAAERVHAQQRRAYDDEDRTPFRDTRHHRGFHTRFGPVHPLVDRADDALAIFGPGEELELRFAAPAVPVAEGWRRVLVLEAVGWCKDRDLYTRDGETVGPLPERGAEHDARDRLHEAYNTRFEAGEPVAGGRR